MTTMASSLARLPRPCPPIYTPSTTDTEHHTSYLAQYTRLTLCCRAPKLPQPPTFSRQVPLYPIRTGQLHPRHHQTTILVAILHGARTPSTPMSSSGVGPGLAPAAAELVPEGVVEDDARSSAPLAAANGDAGNGRDGKRRTKPSRWNPLMTKRPRRAFEILDLSM